MAKKYDLRPLTFRGESGITNHGSLVPANHIRCFYQMVIDNVCSGINEVTIYDTVESAFRKIVRLTPGQKFIETTDDLEHSAPVFAPLQEGSYLGIGATCTYNFSGQYADEEGKRA